MAEEVEMTPVEMTPVEPPKANPLGKPITPTIRKPVVGGAGTTASPLKPGLKLPPKPGIATGLKLPPKPGATIMARPQIRKPGATLATKPLPKPVTTAAPKPPADEPQTPLEALKSATQKLKGVTQPIPQQAVLHKTGIISDAAVSEAQKEAAKHKTARISLADAMGAAPVKEVSAPMKTIRIKRPEGLPTASAPRPSAPVTPAPVTAETVAEPPTVEDSTVTQRKTLKVTRPASKFGIKRPGTQATTVMKTEASAPVEGEVQDIPEMPVTAAPVPHPQGPVDTTPTWVIVLSTIVKLVACVGMGVLAWFLYDNTVTNYF